MPRISHLDQGDVWTVQATFTVNGTPTDPTNVTFKYRNPTGTITTIGPVSGGTGGSGITRVSAGIFTFAITLDDAGRWYARFEGTGAATAAEDFEAVVDPSVFYESAQLSALALVSLGDAKDWLNQQNIDTTDDLELARVINDVSARIVDESGGREFVVNGTNPQTRLFEMKNLGRSTSWYVDGQYMGTIGPGGRVVPIGDCTAITSVSILSGADWTTVLASPTSSQYAKLYQRGGRQPTQPWEPITKLQFLGTVAGLAEGGIVSVTGTWGFPAIPGSIRQAVLDTVAWMIGRDVEHYRTDLGAVSGEHGPVVMMLGGAQQTLSLPPVALAAARAFRIRGVG